MAWMVLEHMIDSFPRCCLTTPDPGKWTAGVDNTADPGMISAMHNIREHLSYQMPLNELVWALRASVQIDSRTMLGGDIQRCLLSNAADRLDILGRFVDPAPWATLSMRLRDAWAVVRGRAVCVYLR